MGQKIHPGGFRIGIIHDWKSNWFSEKEFGAYLIEDVRIRDHIRGKLSHAGLSDIHIRKDSQRITIDIYTARPGIVIGKSGSEVEALRQDVHAMTHKAVHVNINEIKRPELDANLVAQSVAEQLQNRVSFRRAMKRSLASAMRSGAQGVRIRCGGRLGGAEMSRTEQYSEGRVPLHTLRADIDYGFAEAQTQAGRIGVKVWINKGEIMPAGYEGAQQQTTRLGEVDARRRRGVTTITEDTGPSRPERGRRPGGGGGGPAVAAAAVAPGGGGGGRPGGGGGRPGGGGGRRGQQTGPSGPSTPVGRRRPIARRARRPSAPVRRLRPPSTPRAPRGRPRRVTPDAAPTSFQVPQAAARQPRRHVEGRTRRCSSASSASRRSRTAGSRTGRSRPPVSR